ncbi:MAG TPA: sigma-70 family RNA polymerase sigma factor, partial [Planctomycetota bacterium]|nr:sigma-70 family RNA polymerase sigma factor [Planctomycetota bacterium]
MSLSTELFLEYKKQPGKPALARLLENHQDAVYAICLQVLRHPQDAEDACQEVLLEVSRQLDAIEEPLKFTGWLYRTALHTALDVRRSRGRQRAREARVRRPSEPESARPTSDEALHEGLAGLDDSSRILIVEHYLSRRPLRELAMERGCSEVAVWKRLQGARERLKKTLGSAALLDLDAVTKVSAPAGLLRKALGLKGGMVMAAKGGITLAIVAPLVLLGVAGTVVAVRRGEPSSATSAARKAPAEAVRVSDLPMPSPSSSAAVLTPAPRPPRGPQAALRRPYPWKTPLGAANAVAAHTWGILSTKEIALTEENASVAEILEKLGKLTGLTFRFDPSLKNAERISIQVSPGNSNVCLELLMDSWATDYEILSDGAVHVGPKGTITGGYEREARKLEAVAEELRIARERMDGGWDGIRDLHDPSAFKAKKIFIPQGESSVGQEIDRMIEAQMFVRVDVPLHDAKDQASYQAMMNRPFPQVVEERTVGEHVEQLAKMSGLVAVTVDWNLLCLTTEERAAQYRAEEDQRRRAYEAST